LKHIKPGQVAFTVISETQRKERIASLLQASARASTNNNDVRLPLGIDSFGESEEIAGDTLKNSRRNARHHFERGIRSGSLGGTKKEVYRISNKIVRTLNVTHPPSAISAASGHCSRRRHSHRRRRLKRVGQPKDPY